MFDSFLLQAASQVSMIDMRDNMLAADMARFGGANQDIIWNAFAESGLGQGAAGTFNDSRRNGELRLAAGEQCHGDAAPDR